MSSNLRSGLDALRQHALSWTTEDGRCVTPLPGVHFFRGSSPRAIVPGQSHGLTIAVIVQGRKELRTRDATLVYRPGQYLVITGALDFESCVLDATPDTPYLAAIVELAPERVAALLPEMAMPPSNGHAPADAVPYVADLCAPLLDAVVRLAGTMADPTERRLLAPLVRDEILVRLLRSDAAAVLRRAAFLRGDERRIQDAMAYIRAHAHTKLTVQAIAREVAMSPSHFAHRFRAVVRQTPMQYVKRVRLQHARQRLLAQGASAGEAAFASGYQSPSHFSRDFAAYYGLPPSDYARRFRNADTEAGADAV